MARTGPRDVANKRQRVLFGVDALERHVADLTVELLRLIPSSSVTAHVTRMRAYIEEYQEHQRSDFELPGGSDGKKE